MFTGVKLLFKKKKRSVMLELINGFKRNCVCSSGIEFRLTVCEFGEIVFLLYVIIYLM